ncbi:MAG: high-affinity iron transporter [Actinomycetota bacterium]
MLGACANHKSDDDKGASAADTAGAAHIAVTISDAGCDPAALQAAAGKTAFDVTNKGSSSVTEFYVYKGKKVLGEVENVLPGSPKTLALTLTPGTFTIKCPNGTKTESGSLVVSAT